MALVLAQIVPILNNMNVVNMKHYIKYYDKNSNGNASEKTNENFLFDIARNIYIQAA